MNVHKNLVRWKKQGIIDDLEVEFVRFLRQVAPETDDDVFLAAASCLNAQKQGHICFDLRQYKDVFLFGERKTEYGLDKKILERWEAALMNSDLVSQDGKLKPLVLEEGRLYLHKYWKFEEEFTQWILKRASETHLVTEIQNEAIRYFINARKDLFDVNWQEIALCLSFIKDLVVISGGPGTGKTYTVLNIIAAHTVAAKNENKDLKVALAAPTGKAARRLVDSIKEGKASLPDKFKHLLEDSTEAQTVHKLLGASYRGNIFKFDQNNHLPYDLIIVDEASMLDINMWVRLIRAIGPDTKLVVLGDKDQLASVEAGSILGDLCGGVNSFSKTIVETMQQLTGVSLPQAPANSPFINDCVVFLTKSYRFKENSGIQKLASAINSQNGKEVIELLESKSYPDLHWFEPNDASFDKILHRYGISHHKHYEGFQDGRRIEASHKNKILCAIRKTKLGVESVNNAVEIGIKRKNSLISSNEWYDGRLVMATKNDVALRIRNGEMGIYNSKEGKIQFEGEHNVLISPSRLSDYESAFAITIHKSQGSEFEDVAIILPEVYSNVLSKEILYTAVTRARKNTLVFGSKDIIRKTVERSVNRQSGVKGKIWSP
jgi:exodeoxyribonuclease V alpha subunit